MPFLPPPKGSRRRENLRRLFTVCRGIHLAFLSVEFITSTTAAIYILTGDIAEHGNKKAAAIWLRDQAV